MNKKLFERAKAFLQAHHRRSIWYRILSVMAVLVVFVTTYMLVLPAVTMERQTYCGITEHIHTKECYAQKYIFTCGQEEGAGHTHTDDCVTAISILTCAIPEHEHSQSCYSAPQQYTVAIVDDEEIVIDNAPALEDFPAFSFDTEDDGAQILDEESLAETQAKETETETSTETEEPVEYFCGQEEHQHSAECFDENKMLICGKKLHTHNEQCLVPQTESETEATAETTEAIETETAAETTEATATEAAAETTEATETETKAETTETAETEIVAEMTEAAETETTAETTETAETEIVAETTETETEPQTQKAPANNWGGFDGAGIEEPGIGGEAGGRTFVQDSDGTLQEVNQSETETEDASESETETESDTVNIEETETESESESDSEAVSETEETSEAGSESETELVSETESETGAGSETETETETETENDTEAAPANDYMGGDPGLGFEDNGELSNGIEPENKETEPNNETGAQYICGLAEHTHNEDCYDEEGNLICEQEEHTHTDECYGVMPMADEGFGSGAYQDLTKYLKGVSGTGTEVVPGTEFYKTNLSLQFFMQTTDIGNGKFVYLLPEGIILPDDMLGKWVDGKDGDKKAFSFSIEKDETTGRYRVLIDFDETYVEEAGETITGSVNFWANLSGENKNEQGGFNVHFQDNVDLDIPMEQIKDKENETWKYDINITKGQGRLEGNKLKYDIYVKTAKGTPGPVELDDILKANGLNVSGVTVTGVTANNYKDILGECTIEYGSDGKSFHMILPKMSPAQYENGNWAEGDKGDYSEYHISYEYTVDDIPAGLTAVADNKATVQSQSKEPEPGDIVKQETNVSTSITKQLLNKTASHDAAAGTITWTITVNNDEGVIDGAVLTDTMFSRFTGDELKKFIEPQDGFTVTLDENGKVKSLNFTKLPDGSSNKNKYVIEYTTEAKAGFTSYEITNDAVIDNPGGGHAEQGQSVTVAGEGDVDKECKGQQGEITSSADGKDIVQVQWTSKVKIPSGGLDQDTVKLTDNIDGGYNPDKQWMTKAQLQTLIDGTPWLNAEDVSCKASWTEKPFSAVQEDEKIIAFYITLHKDRMKDYAGNWLELTYNTWCDVTEKDSKLTFYNEIQLDKKSKQVTFEIERKSHVLKMDANGNKSDSTIKVSESGEIEGMTWLAKVYFETDFSGPVIITDTLPDGILFESLSFGKKDEQSPVSATGPDAEGKMTLSANKDGLDISGTYDPETKKVELKVQLQSGASAPDYFKQGGEFWVTYHCKLSDEFKARIDSLSSGEKIPFENTVNVKIGEQELDWGTDTQIQYVEFSKETVEEKELSKSGSWDGVNHKINYSVDINPNATNYIPDSEPPYEADTLKLDDRLEYVAEGGNGIIYSVELDMSSVELWAAKIGEDGKPERDQNGRLIKDRKLDASEWNWKASSSKNPYNATLYRDITATIPDSMALIFEYTYNVKGEQTQELGEWDQPKVNNITNTVTLNGESSDQHSTGGQDSWEDHGMSGEASTERSYKFYKLDSNNFALKLNGAEFALYEYNLSSEDTLIADPFKISSEGMFCIDKNDLTENGGKIEKGKLYYVVETKAPAGYKLPKNPPKYYFYFETSSDVKPSGLTDDMNAVNLSTSSRTEYCSNEMEVTDLDVEKVWIDEDGQRIEDPDTSVHVQLKRYAILDSDWKKYGFEKSTGTGGSTSGSTGGKMLPITFTIKNTSDYGVVADWDGGNVREFPVGSIIHVRLYHNWPGGNYSFWEPKLDLKNSVETIEDIGKLNNERTEYAFSFELKSPTEISGTYCAGANKPNNEVFLEVTAELPPLETEPQPTEPEETDPTPVEKKKPSEVKFGEVENYGKPITLKQGNWQYHWNNLPLLGMVEDGEHKGEVLHYVYFVEETPVPDNYVVSYENNDGIDDGKIIITNTESNKPKISVKKVWDEKGTTDGSLTHDAITVQLYKVGEPDTPIGDLQTLNADNSWTYTWIDGLEEGAQYYVKEEPTVSGYDVWYEYSENDSEKARSVTVQPNIANPTITITNTRKTTEVEVEKVWLSANGVYKTDGAKLPEITVQLWKKGDTTKGETDTEIEEIKLGTTHANKDSLIEDGYSATGWGYKWSNLPEGEYYVVEDPEVEGFTATYKAGAEGTEGSKASDPKLDGTEVTVESGTLIVINTEVPTKFEVEKVWKDNDGNLLAPGNGESVEMTLYSSTVPPETEAEPEPTPEATPTPTETETDPTETPSPETTPTPGEGESGSETPSPTPETTPEPDTDPEETPSPTPEKTVYPVVTVKITGWVNSQGTIVDTPNSGWVWAQLFEVGSGGTWIGPVAAGTLSADDKWAPIELKSNTPISPIETKQYALQCGGGNDTEKNIYNPVVEGHFIQDANIWISGENSTITYDITPTVKDEQLDTTQPEITEWITIPPINITWNGQQPESDTMHGWVKICEYEGSEMAPSDWETDQSWSIGTGGNWTVPSTVPTQLAGKDSNGKVYKYCIQIGIDDPPISSRARISVNGAPYENGCAELLIDGNNLNPFSSGLNVIAELKDTGVTEPDPDAGSESESKTVRVLLEDKAADLYGLADGVLKSKNIETDTDSVIVRIVYNNLWNIQNLEEELKAIILDGSDGEPTVTIFENCGEAYADYIVSNIEGDCDLILKFDTNGKIWPRNTKDGPLSCGYNNDIIEQPQTISTLSTNSGMMRISAPTATVSAPGMGTVAPSQSLGAQEITYTAGHARPADAKPMDTVVLSSNHAGERDRMGENGLTGTYSENGWKYTWDNLPRTDEDGNTIYYYVEEKPLGNGYTTDYNYRYVDEDHHSKGYAGVTVTNKKPPTMEVEVQKTWAGEGDPLGSIQVQLSNSRELVGSVTLNEENDWYYKWEGLPIDTYYVQEVLGDAASNFDVSYSSNGSMVTITNTSTSVGVKKKWYDKNGAELTNLPESITDIIVQLYKSDDGTPIDTQTLNEANDWSYLWSHLKPGTYYVKEDPEVTGFTATYTTGDGTTQSTDPKDAQTSGGTITISNYENTEIEVKKVWNDKKTNHDGITVELYSSTTPPNKDIVKANKEAENIASTMQLSLGVTDWVDDNNDEAEPTTNGSVWMTVQECNSQGEPLPGENGDSVVYANSLTASNNWRQTTQELPAEVITEDGEKETKYYLLRFGSENTDTQAGIQNLSVLNGPNETNGIVVSGDASESGKLNYNLQATVSGTEVVRPVNNTRMMMLSSNGGGTAAETTTKGLNLPSDAREPIDKVTLKDGNLHGKGEGTTLDGSYGDTSWHYKWENLPTVNKNGERLYYYVKEESVSNYNAEYAYEYEYASDGSVKGVKLVTITNTPNKIKITAKKVWEWGTDGPANATEIQKDFELQLDLQYSTDGEDWTSCGNQTLKDNKWTAEWDGLDAGRMYRVVEYLVKSSPYTFTPTIVYSWGDETKPLYGDGNVTVTNVYTPTYYTLPETGGTGTLPYTIGGALLTAFATLLLYIQNKRRKEGQGTS